MNFGNYTQKSLEAVQSAQNLAVQNSHQQLEQLHLMLALQPSLQRLTLTRVATKAAMMSGKVAR